MGVVYRAHDERQLSKIGQEIEISGDSVRDDGVYHQAVIDRGIHRSSRLEATSMLMLAGLAILSATIWVCSRNLVKAEAQGNQIHEQGQALRLQLTALPRVLLDGLKPDCQSNASNRRILRLLVIIPVVDMYPGNAPDF